MSSRLSFCLRLYFTGFNVRVYELEFLQVYCRDGGDGMRRVMDCRIRDKREDGRVRRIHKIKIITIKC